MWGVGCGVGGCHRGVSQGCKQGVYTVFRVFFHKGVLLHDSANDFHNFLRFRGLMMFVLAGRLLQMQQMQQIQGRGVHPLFFYFCSNNYIIIIRT